MSERTKPRFFIVLFSILIFGAGTFFSDEIAEGVWKGTHNPQVTFLFDPSAKRALEIGHYYFNVGGGGAYNIDIAERYYEEALARDPLLPEVWHQLARIDFLRGDFDLALEKINTQITLHGDSFMASYYIRGLISGFAEDFEQAEQDFLHFLSWDPNNWAARNDLAWVYFTQGRFQEAVIEAGTGLLYYPENPWLLTMRGTALLNLERFDEAEKDLREAYTIAKRLPPSVWERAYPGNDPRIAEGGLSAMIATIEENIMLVESRREQKSENSI